VFLGRAVTTPKGVGKNRTGDPTIMPHVLNCELKFTHGERGEDRILYEAGTPVELYPKPPKGDPDEEASYCYDRASWLNKQEKGDVYVAAVLDGRPRILRRDTIDQVATLPTVELEDPKRYLRPVPAA
jgi:hypothetical protein